MVNMDVLHTALRQGQFTAFIIINRHCSPLQEYWNTTHIHILHTQNAIRVDYFFFVKDNPLGKSHIMWMKCVMTDIMFIIE